MAQLDVATDPRAAAASEGNNLFLAGNSAKILINGDQFFPEMLAAIREAQRSITLETYIWCPGRISDQFLAVLDERARAGVKVHVLVDGMGTLKFKHTDRDRLRDAGVEFYKYRRKHWWHINPNFNHRNHRKILVVDGRIGFTGGMCIDDRWLGNADAPNRWRETQVRLEGPVVREMQAAFDLHWAKTTKEHLAGAGYFPPLSPVGTVRARCCISSPSDGYESAERDYLAAIAAARRSIDIANAYFIPDDIAITALLAARQRGVRVRIVIPLKNDSRFGRAASRSRWGKLLAAGVEFHLYSVAMYHAKTMAIDDRWVAIGSVNFDHRSFKLNDEIAATFVDATVAAKHREMFEQDIARSVPLTLEEFRGRSILLKVADHFAGMFRWVL